MDLSEKKNSIINVVWTYNLCSDGIDKEAWAKAESILHSLIEIIELRKDTISEQEAKGFFAQTVSDLEKIFNVTHLDDCGIYEYGGLNYFFADIMETLNFTVKKGKFALISNFVYGTDFED
jgi:hypothetical protein